jgi:hypothetical protein
MPADAAGQGAQADTKDASTPQANDAADKPQTTIELRQRRCASESEAATTEQVGDS